MKIGEIVLVLVVVVVSILLPAAAGICGQCFERYSRSIEVARSQAGVDEALRESATFD
jgi:hypothetical protein